MTLNDNWQPDGTFESRHAEMSVDPNTSEVVVHSPRLGDVRFTKTQIDAIQEAFIRSCDTTVELSAAARLSVLTQMPCTANQCGQKPSVATDSNGAPRCWDHQQEAIRVSKPWMGGDCA